MIPCLFRGRTRHRKAKSDVTNTLRHERVLALTIDGKWNVVRRSALKNTAPAFGAIAFTRGAKPHWRIRERRAMESRPPRSIRCERSLTESRAQHQAISNACIGRPIVRHTRHDDASENRLTLINQCDACAKGATGDPSTRTIDWIDRPVRTILLTSQSIHEFTHISSVKFRLEFVAHCPLDESPRAGVCTPKTRIGFFGNHTLWHIGTGEVIQEDDLDRHIRCRNGTAVCLRRGRSIRRITREQS